jgi:hypothetical protein
MNLRRSLFALLLLALLPSMAQGAGGFLLLAKPGTDANATAWAAAVVVAGGTVSGTQLTNVSNLITAYKSAGVYSVMDEEWLYASENPFTAKVSIVPPYHSHTLVGSTPPAFTANRGYDAGATGLGYIDTGYITGSNFTLNAHSFGAYVFTSRTSAATGTCALGSQSTAYTILQPLNGASTTSVASSDNTFPTFADTQANGSIIVVRTSSSNVNFYKNANSVLSASATSVAVPNLNWYALAFNSGGSAVQFYPIGEIVSSIFMGGTMNGTQAAAKNAALNAYMTAVGANVY